MEEKQEDRESLITLGLTLSNMQFTAMYLAGFVLILATVLINGSLYSGIPEDMMNKTARAAAFTSAIGWAILIDIPFILFTVFCVRMTNSFKKLNPEEFAAGQKRIESLRGSNRLIWNSGSNGKPINRSGKKK